jgi:hypothetical protein
MIVGESEAEGAPNSVVKRDPNPLGDRVHVERPIVGPQERAADVRRRTRDPVAEPSTMPLHDRKGDAGRHDPVGAGQLVGKRSVAGELGKGPPGGGVGSERLAKDLVDEEPESGEETKDRSRERSVQGDRQGPYHRRHEATFRRELGEDLERVGERWKVTSFARADCSSADERSESIPKAEPSD